GRSAYASLQKLVKENDSSQLFRSRIKSLRDKIGSHYDQAEVLEALHKMANEPTSELRDIVGTGLLHETRFRFADAVMERIIGELLWEVPHDSKTDVQNELYDIYDWCMNTAKDFMVFGGDLVL